MLGARIRFLGVASASRNHPIHTVRIEPRPNDRSIHALAGRAIELAGTQSGPIACRRVVQSVASSRIWTSTSRDGGCSLPISTMSAITFNEITPAWLTAILTSVAAFSPGGCCTSSKRVIPTRSPRMPPCCYLLSKHTNYQGWALCWGAVSGHGVLPRSPPDPYPLKSLYRNCPEIDQFCRSPRVEWAYSRSIRLNHVEIKIENR